MKRIAVLLIALAAFATACSSGNVFSLTVGDCFNNRDVAAQISDVELVGCTDPHDNEVFSAYDVTGSVFPGQAAVQEDAADGCLDRFEPFVGADYFDSSLGISFLTPSDESWEQGDREVVCFLYDLNGTKLTTSVRGTGI